MTPLTLILSALVLWTLATVPVGVAFGRAFAAGERPDLRHAPASAPRGTDAGHVA